MLGGLIKRWRSPHRPASADAAAAPSSPINEATYADIGSLVGLQRYARRIDLGRGQPARAQLAGNHNSRFRGRGMDYQESRNYQPGDDIRNMDWRVTARAGRPHTKLFQEERERPVVLFLDLNPGMFFASRGALKSVIAARTAALIAWAAAARGDRIGALLFNGGHHELRPRNGQRGVLQLIHALGEHTDPRKGLSASPHPGALNDALVRLRRIVRPGSLVYLISDFYALDETTSDHLLHLRRHNDLAAIQIFDPLELTPPPAGHYAVTDGHTRGLLDMRSSGQRSHYEEFFRQQHKLVRDTLRKRGVPLLQLSTCDDVSRVLQAHFAGASRRSRNPRHAA